MFYESLYVGDVANARVSPALRTLKQNVTSLSAILTDKAQALAIKVSYEDIFRSIPYDFAYWGKLSGLLSFRSSDD